MIWLLPTLPTCCLAISQHPLLQTHMPSAKLVHCLGYLPSSSLSLKCSASRVPLGILTRKKIPLFAATFDLDVLLFFLWLAMTPTYSSSLCQTSEITVAFIKRLSQNNWNHPKFLYPLHCSWGFRDSLGSMSGIRPVSNHFSPTLLLSPLSESLSPHTYATTNVCLFPRLTICLLHGESL